VPLVAREERPGARRVQPPWADYKRHGLLYNINGVGHIEQAYARAVKLFTRKQWIRRRVTHD